jgi:spermidine synthase
VRLDRDRLLYGVTVFLSAVLLLLVQPMLTKAILPWFGGLAGVWTSSMLFFQVLLLFGYLYAHLLARRLPLRAQSSIHLALLALSLLLLPLKPNPAWKPNAAEDPLPRILGMLATTVGLPYLVLSTTTPLLQSWFAQRTKVVLPYRLFAISNLGSLVALIAYPAAMEPLLSTQWQLNTWSAAYVIFAVLCATAAWPGLRIATSEPVRRSEPGTLWTWLALAACPSIMWLAVANHLSQDVAPVPFLWVLPLSLYLLSFVLCFDHERWYRPQFYRWALPASWVAVFFGVRGAGYMNIKHSVPIFAAALFLCCMFCHGELARRKPPTGELTTYYLTIAAGGALSGIFVALAAPRLFNEYLELPLAVLGSVLLALWLLYRFPAKRVVRLGAVTLAATVAALIMRSSAFDHTINLRNFYGTLQVTDNGSASEQYRSLYNGAIQHGVQFTSAERSRIPTTYYGPASGAAIVLKALRTGLPMRVGMVGLGVGTFAAYAEPQDVFRFYEINPEVIRLARTEFRYLRESYAKTEVVPGDARLSLEREPAQNYNVLAVDAFAGDSIPIHLLTREAFALYFHHLAPGGALAIHVTNKHLDLAPVVKRLADAYSASSYLIHNSDEDHRKIYSSSWVIVTKNRNLAPKLEYLSSPIKGRAALWTDDYSNIVSVLR